MVAIMGGDIMGDITDIMGVITDIMGAIMDGSTVDGGILGLQ
jgi:hypothetical protein